MKTYSWLNQNRFLSHLRTIFCALAILGASLTLPSAEAGGPRPRQPESFSPASITLVLLAKSVKT